MKSAGIQESDEISSCACGCGTTFPTYDKWQHRPRRYVNGHHQRGKTNSMYGRDRSGKNNPMYGRIMSQNPSYSHLHRWVKIYKPKPMSNLCEICNVKPYRHLANISKYKGAETYNRDFKNWQWLCIQCHRGYDGKK